MQPGAVLMTAGKLSAGDVERLRERWRRLQNDPHRAIVLDAVAGGLLSPNQARAMVFGPGMRVECLGPVPLQSRPLPIPFCWGPNGALLLLLAMLAGYAIAVALWWAA